MTDTVLLIRRLEQVRAHLDPEHRHLVDLVYGALDSSGEGAGSRGEAHPASAQAVTVGASDDQAPGKAAPSPEPLPPPVQLHRYSTKVGDAA